MAAELALTRTVRAPLRAGRPALARALLCAAAAAGVVFVVMLWASGGGAGDLAATRADALVSVGRLSGLLSAHLLLVQVLLMARVPLIERAFGQDRLAGAHRFTGFASMNLLAVHLATVIVGYAQLQGNSVARQAWDLVRHSPGVLLAATGTLALILVTLTSIRVARRALRYESWHLLHLYAYLGVGFALPHQLWTGQEFIDSPAARAYWWTTWTLAAAAVLLFRLGLPFWRSVRHGLTVTSVSREGADVVTVNLSGRALYLLPARAGQYFVWRFLDGPGWTRGHPYSLSAAPDGNSIRITARDGGDNPGRLTRLRPGTWVLIEGPYGRLTSAALGGKPVAMFAGGIGITPLRALLEEVGRDAVLIYRASGESDVPLRGELDDLAVRLGIPIHYVLGPRSATSSWRPASHDVGTDTEALLALVPDLAQRAVVICGPDGWADAVEAAARGAGVVPRHLHRERFGW